jgi:hypothetical protein
MMHDMMGGSGMWIMGIVGALVVVVLLLSLAALIKYLFFDDGHGVRWHRTDIEPLAL